MSSLAHLTVLALVPLALSCDLGVVPFHCEKASQCVSDGTQGRCEPTGACSFPDKKCTSGFRYGLHTEPPLSNACVERCVAQVALGGAHACLRRTDGAILCWGDNTAGKLGTGATEPIAAPKVVSGIEGAVDLVMGGDHACAIVGDGHEAWCWGDNGSGQTGASPMGPGAAPQPVVDASGQHLANLRSLALGRAHSCAFDGSSVWCWGDNRKGQLGAGASGQSSTPAKVPLPSGDIARIAAGGDSTCALVGGDLVCWGDNFCNKLGIASGATFPSPTASGVSVSAPIVLGESHGCASSGSDIVCWGQTKDDDRCSADAEVVDGEKRAPESLSSGAQHTCVVYEQGDVACWGQGDQGELGPGLLAHSQLKAVNVPIPEAVQVAAGGAASCALLASGDVLCWGDNTTGQLGAPAGTFQTPEPGAAVDWVNDAVVCP